MGDMAEKNCSQIQRAEMSLERMLDWSGRFDTRVAFLAGIAIAMLGVLGGIVTNEDSLFCTDVFASIAGTGLVLCLLFIYKCQYPRTESPNHSLIFFDTIAKLDIESFKEKFRSQDENQYLNDLLYQIHQNAHIISDKFFYFKLAMVLLLIAAIPWTIAIYLALL